MKILLTGGGTGGHFYPLIAIAEGIHAIAKQEKILDIKLYYAADDPYDKRALFNNTINFVYIPAGKLRTYRSIHNFFDMFKTFTGVIVGMLKIFSIYPDVIISKGGYVAFPTVLAAKFFRIPVIIHESDSYPGRLNLWTSKFANRIAVSYPEAGEFFPKERTAHTGQPIRREILNPNVEGSNEFFKFDSSIPTILIQGGSQGAEVINDCVLDALPLLLPKYQVIHQTGVKNYDNVHNRANFILEKNQYKGRYKDVAYMNELTTKMAAGCATLVVSRAGSAIFEIACWGIPSIIIPITNSNGDHQRKNAFNYARSGACEVIEESNLTEHILNSEIDKLMKDPKRLQHMHESAKKFGTPDAGNQIARVAIDIALSHEE